MQAIRYQGVFPTVDRGPEGDWQLAWDRTVEAQIISDFLNKTRGGSAIVRVRNSSSRDLFQIEKSLERLGHDDVVDPRVYSGRDYFWCYLVGLCAERGLALPNLLGEIISYSSNANAVLYSRSEVVRQMALAARRALKAGTPMKISEIISLHGLKSVNANFDDYPIDDFATANRMRTSYYFDAFHADYQKSAEAQKVCGNSVYVLNIPYDQSYSEKLKDQVLATGNIRVICPDSRHDQKPIESSYEIEGNLLSLHLNMLTLGEIKDVIRPVWVEKDGAFVEDVFAQLIRPRYYRQVRQKDDRDFAEAYASVALNAVVNLLAGPTSDLQDSDIAPKPALLDASVQNDRLRLAGMEQTGSDTTSEELEALRSMHLADVERLQRQLAGSNAGPGLSHRLNVLRDALGQPLSSASSLIVATQVRALEDMMPAVSAMLADVTAADVGATITGVGLYARQFPAWTRFIKVAEAEISPALLELEGTLQDAIRKLGENLQSQPDSLVDQDLKEALSKIGEAAENSSDKVIAFGRARGIGNAYRAIARYLKERREGSVFKFNEEIDSLVGQQSAKLVLAGVMAAAAAPLSTLAAAAPTEFGWFLAVYAMLNLKDEKD